MSSLIDSLPPFPQSLTLGELSEAAGYPVAYLRDECQRLYGDGALTLFADGAELRVRREPTAELLSTTEVARRLGVSLRRVQTLIKAGRLDAVRPGRDWLVAEASLVAVAERKPGYPPGRKRS